MRPPYPRFVAKKISELADVADGYEQAAAIPYRKAEKIRQQIGEMKLELQSRKAVGGPEPDAATQADLVAAQAEVDQLIQLTGERQQIFASQKQELLQAQNWMTGLADGTKLIESRAIRVEGSTQSLRSQLADCRTQIDNLQAKAKQLYPQGNRLTIEGKLKRFIMASAYTVEVTIESGDQISMQWTKPGTPTVSKPADFFALACALEPDGVLELLMGGADIGGLKARADAALAQISAEVLANERKEESLIAALADTGAPVERRVYCSPPAILGCEIATASSARHADAEIAVA